MKIQYIINKQKVDLEVKANQTLLSALRENDYSEVKCGCDEGECGSCSVLLDNQLVNSCQILAMSVANHDITTVKGIGTLHNPHQLQKSFVEGGADQCGFCSPGMILAGYSVLEKTKNNPTHEEILVALDGNLCRCTGYVKIVAAVEDAAKKLREQEGK